MATFRPLTRKKQAISQAECDRILTEELRGVLSVLGDDGYPYGMPLNHWYDASAGKLYFHSGKFGHKVDAISRWEKVSFCVYDTGYRNEGEWAWNIKSVIVFGRMHPVTDFDTAMRAVRALSEKFTADIDYIELEIERSARNTLVYELVIEYMSGKLVNEA